jgi:hypothetical protein
MRACGARLLSPLDVQVIDLSRTGGLIRCAFPLRVADRAEIQMVMGYLPFVASVKVVRIADEHTRDGMIAFGIRFVAVDRDAAAVLHSFLN